MVLTIAAAFIDQSERHGVLRALAIGLPPKCMFLEQPIPHQRSMLPPATGVSACQPDKR